MNKNAKNKIQSSKIVSMIRFLFFTLVAFTPLIMYSGTSELFEFNKMLFIYLIATGICTLWVIDIILYRKRLKIPRLLSYTILFFFISQLISTIFSIDIHTSLFGYYGRFNGGLFSIITYIILLYTFIQYFNRTLLEKLLKISLLSSVFVILWGLPGKFGYDLSCLLFTGELNNTCWTDQFRPSERMFSTLGQPNWLGAYLSIHFFIGIYFLIKGNLKNISSTRILFFAYSILNFSAILFTRSRSAFGAVLIAAALFPLTVIFIYRAERQKLLRSLKIYALTILVLVLSMVIFQTGIQKIDSIITYIPDKVFNNNAEVNTNDTPAPAPSPTLSTGVTDSFDIRKIVWEGAIDLGNQYPFFGTGVETFAYSYYFVRPVEHNLTSEWDFLYNKAHNEFLNYFATTGYLGIITYLLMIIAVFYIGLSHIIKYSRTSFDKSQVRHLTSPSNNALLISCLLLSYLTILVTNFFGFSTTSVNIFFYLIPGFMYIIYSSEEEEDLPEQPISVRRKMFVLVPIAISLYVVVFLIQYFFADLQYSRAEAYSRAGEYQHAAVEYNELLQMHYEHVYEDKLSYVLANLAYIAAYQEEDSTADNLMDLSQFYNQKSREASSMNINYWKTTVKNDYLFYQSKLDVDYIKEGIKSLQTARSISPTDPKLPYSEALFYSVLEDEENDPDEKLSLQQKSLASIDTAIELKPDYRDSYFLKGQLLKKYGRIEEAGQTFQFIVDHINPADTEVQTELAELE